MSVPLPQNLPLLINDPRPDAQKVVAHILKEGSSLELKDVLFLLGQHWKIRVWFNAPVDVYTQRHWKTEVINGESCKTYSGHRTDTVHTFNKFFQHGSSLCYSVCKQARTGYYFEWFDKVIKYEPVIESVTKMVNVFENYEQFKRKFDLKFITEDAIKDLWNGKSSQHGGQYKPSDFHAIGPVGRKVMADFLRFFNGIGTGGKDTPGYSKSPYGDYYVLQREHCSYHHSGRDIRISHQTNCPYVFYSSEFSGCGNGRYGLVANKNYFLHVEDD